ncbi:TRAF-interacting protein with FHA domain-containing protein A [Mobula hypostoma]|uniref:TRAF-interacting protein with FHA domain-containing protein A n=1 Tax=Mobula hypostoma TaxID=723540 RepID=UPI002FC29781
MSFETDETEETITCLHIRVYHPQASVFRSLNFNEKQKHRGEESIKFGRDSKVCQFPLLDKRASRIQFVLQSFRHADSSELCFEIKNASLRTLLSVNGIALDHLNRIDLPNKCILRFGEFQFYLEKESGEDKEHFEVKFNLSLVPFCQEGTVETLSHPVTESGVLNVPVTLHQSQSAVETDENELISY